MPVTFTLDLMVLAPSDVIAVLALVVAVISTLYARASAIAARSGNKINLHQPRKEICDALIDFRRLFRGMDAHPNDEEIDAFFTRAVAPAQIYLQPELAARIHSIYQRSWELYRYIDVAESTEGAGSKWDYIEPFQELGRTELEEVIKAVTREVHVGSH